MVSIKDRKILRQMFSHYDYVMTTAQLSKEKLYYRDIQRMLGAGLIGIIIWTALKLRGSDSYALLGAIGSMLAILFYVVLYNRMMVYVENHAYRATPDKEAESSVFTIGRFSIPTGVTISVCRKQVHTLKKSQRI